MNKDVAVVGITSQCGSEQLMLTAEHSKKKTAFLVNFLM